jgi:preprotein translocase subunit SecE
LVERRSPKPQAGSSSLSARAKIEGFIMDKLIQYFKDSYQELMYKVTWPTVAELQSSTAVVFVASLIIALMIALMDQILQFSLQGFYGLFS